ncbi:MAG: hypothetical protein IBX68_12405 [Dehalococcoidia bacterium]|nr:hypothetical protein [Dehalococcoidia bacterium]
MSLRKKLKNKGSMAIIVGILLIATGAAMLFGNLLADKSIPAAFTAGAIGVILVMELPKNQ